MNKTSRRQIYVVINNRTVWKHLFFMKRDKAFDAVKRFYGRHLEWEQVDDDTIKCNKVQAAGTSFKAMTLKEYTNIGDVPYSDNTKWITGEDHK